MDLETDWTVQRIVTGEEEKGEVRFMGKKGGKRRKSKTRIAKANRVDGRNTNVVDCHGPRPRMAPVL